MSVNGQEKSRAPVILQASWIAAAPTEAPGASAVIAPEPVAIAPEPPPALPEPAPAPRARPETKKQAPAKSSTKTRSKPVLAKPADTPGPVAQTSAVSETPSWEEAPAGEFAAQENPVAEAPGASANTSASASTSRAAASGVAGHGASNGSIIPPSHANYLSNPRPDYPDQSRAQGEQGVVSLRVHVSTEGRSRSVALHKTSGHARLDDAAMEAVWRWRFVPARQDGRPVEGVVIIPVRFDLWS
jgi:protein TonB